MILNSLFSDYYKCHTFVACKNRYIQHNTFIFKAIIYKYIGYITHFKIITQFRIKYYI